MVIALAVWMVWRIRRMQKPTTHGLHGGPVLKTGDGLVEVSVFETGVPPRFRLYFFDEARLAIAPPSDIEVTCQTIRPEEAGEGAGQIFHFKSHVAYLEATEELPEPHEFELKLTLRRAGIANTLTTRFVEDHDHHHGHGGHSHAVSADADRRKLAIALGLILGLMVLEIVVGLIADSLALVSDAAHMLTDAVAIGLSLWAASLATRPARGAMTYGGLSRSRATARLSR